MITVSTPLDRPSFLDGAAVEVAPDASPIALAGV